MKRKILFVIPDLQHGGAERVVVRLLEHLPRARFELHLALVQRKGALLSEVPGDIEIHDARPEIAAGGQWLRHAGCQGILTSL